MRSHHWLWSYGSWIYNYLCNQCLSPLMLWVRISIRARCTTLCDKVCQWLATGWWFSLLWSLVSFTNKTDHHNIAEILLKVALNTIKQTYRMIISALNFVSLFWHCNLILCNASSITLLKYLHINENVIDLKSWKLKYIKLSMLATTFKSSCHNLTFFQFHYGNL